MMKHSKKLVLGLLACAAVVVTALQFKQMQAPALPPIVSVASEPSIDSGQLQEAATRAFLELGWHATLISLDQNNDLDPVLKDFWQAGFDVVFREDGLWGFRSRYGEFFYTEINRWEVQQGTLIVKAGNISFPVQYQQGTTVYQAESQEPALAMRLHLEKREHSGQDHPIEAGQPST